MSPSPSDVSLCDSKYFTEDLLDWSKWSYSFEDLVKQFNVKCELVEKKFLPVCVLSNLKNGGRKYGLDDEDVENLKLSFKNGINTNCPPILVTEDNTALNGSTRIEVCNQLGIAIYPVFVLRFESELDRIDLESLTNDPERNDFQRYLSKADIQVNVESWISQYQIEKGEAPDERQVKAKVFQYSKNTLGKKDQNALYKLIINGNANVAPSRYKDWTVNHVKSYLKSELCNDIIKDDYKDGVLDIFFHNTTHNSTNSDCKSHAAPRWSNFFDHLYKCVKNKQPMNIVGVTPPPDYDGGEKDLRKHYLKEIASYKRKLDDIFEYKIRNGCYPFEHEDATIKFAPSLHSEVDEGVLIDG